MSQCEPRSPEGRKEHLVPFPAQLEPAHRHFYYSYCVGNFLTANFVSPQYEREFSCVLLTLQPICSRCRSSLSAQYNPVRISGCFVVVFFAFSGRFFSNNCLVVPRFLPMVAELSCLSPRRCKNIIPESGAKGSERGVTVLASVVASSASLASRCGIVSRRLHLTGGAADQV